MSASKMWKSDMTAKAGMSVGKEVARMHGSADNYVQTDSHATFIAGPVSFMSNPENVRMAGMWTMNKAMNLMIPSTLGTPQQVLNFEPPIKGLANIMKGAAAYMALYGMLTGIAAA